LSISADRLKPYVVDQAMEHRPDFDVPKVIDPAESEAPILAGLDVVDAKTTRGLGRRPPLVSGPPTSVRATRHWPPSGPPWRIS